MKLKIEVTKEKNVLLKIVNENEKTRERVTNTWNVMKKENKEENEFIAKYRKNISIVKEEGRRKPKNEALKKSRKKR